MATHPGGEADQGTSSRPLAGLPRGSGESGPGRRSRALGRAHHRRDRRAREGRRDDEPDRATRGRADRGPRQGHSGLRPRRHRPGRLQGDRGHPLPRAGLRGRLHRPQQRQGHRGELHGPQISFGEGVERVFPLHSPNINSITVVRRGKVRRAKLYYLRDRRGKAARITEKTNYKPGASAGANA